MNLQGIIGYIILIYGCVFGLALFIKSIARYRNASTADDLKESSASGLQDALKESSASSLQDALETADALSGKKSGFIKYGLAEFVVFFSATMGFPDYIVNTLFFKRTGWVESKNTPPTLVATTVMPGGIIAFSYLRNGGFVETTTLLLCVAAIGAGSFCGARVMTKLDGTTIKKIMAVALILSMGAIVAKMIVSAGASGDNNALAMWQLAIAVPVSFGLGFINMFGVPMKPPATAMFLLLGMSPMSALTLMLVMAFVSPAAGCYQVLKSELYHPGVCIGAVTFGSVAAAIGCMFTISLDPLVLNIILLVIMGVTVVSVFRSN